MRQTAIHYDEKSQLFHLSTKNTSYVLQIVRDGYVAHRYWGKRVNKWTVFYAVIATITVTVPHDQSGKNKHVSYTSDRNGSEVFSFNWMGWNKGGQLQRFCPPGN